jgi:hypothetical protein
MQSKRPKAICLRHAIPPSRSNWRKGLIMKQYRRHSRPWRNDFRAEPVVAACLGGGPASCWNLVFECTVTGLLSHGFYSTNGIAKPRFFLVSIGFGHAVAVITGAAHRRQCTHPFDCQFALLSVYLPDLLVDGSRKSVRACGDFPRCAARHL